MSRSQAAEFSLLVDCCRWNFLNANSERLPEPRSGLDWTRFVALARFHRIQGLVWNALARDAGRLPDDAREALSSDARSIAATNLGIASECCELLRLFDQAKLALLFIKGLTVSALAYRSPLLKMGWDIDLLIDPDDLTSVAQLLHERGYALRLPESLDQLWSWHSRSKESVWCRDGSHYIELHTRLADNRRLIPTIDVHSPRQMVEVTSGVLLPTLAAEELIAYLAVHGASSAWFRLKWISDYAALLDGRSGKDIEHLYRRSQELGAGRAAGQALLLADALFGVLGPVPGLQRELAADRSTRMICDAALRMLTEGNRDPTERLLGTFSIHWTQFLLLPGLDYKFSEVRRQGGLLMKHVQ